MKNSTLALILLSAFVLNFDSALGQPLIQAQPALSATAAPNADFFDDFNDGNANGWLPSNASRWQISTQNGSPAYCLYIANPNGDEFSVMNTMTWTNFTMEVDAKATAASGNFFIAFGLPNASNLSNYYYLQFAGGVNLYRVFAPGSGIIVASSLDDLASDNQYHHIRLERVGANLKVYGDFQLLFEYTDATLFTTGYIGLGSFQSTACFDNVSISSSVSAVGLVVYFSQSINDDALSPSRGDSDGRPEYCEKVELNVTVRNAGTTTATNVTGTLTTSDSDVSIFDNDNCWPDIPAGATAVNSCQFGFSVSSNLLQNKTATFTLTITASNGGPWTSTFSVPVYTHDRLFYCDVRYLSPGVSNSMVTWADVIGNDGRLDLLFIGQDENSKETTKFYRNDGGGSFADVSATASLIGVRDGSVAWGDYDNDDDLDLLLTGDATNSAGIPYVTRLYRYDTGGRFTLIATTLPGVRNGKSAWGDYDNDGDLDILLTGASASGNISKIYRNEGGTNFVEAAVNLTGVAGGSAAAWGDYDNDGDWDILLAGEESPGKPVTKIYQNNNGSFTEINANLPGVSACALAWGDYNQDGNLDILLAGRTSAGSRITRVYRNNTNGNFSDTGAGLIGVENGAVVWGDYENGGELDILLTGDSDSGPVTKIYRNVNGTFVDFSGDTPLTEAKFSSAAWGDYDGDGDLDILLAGLSNSGRVAIVFQSNRSNPGISNTPPTAPFNLTSSVSGSAVTLRWDKATDSKTLQDGLTYNVRVGRTPNGMEVVSPMSNLLSGPLNGFRRVPKIGNTNHRNSLTIKNLPPGTYFWSVQAIDNAFAGSAFANEQNIFVPGNRAPTVANAIPPRDLAVGGTAFTLDLNAAPAVFNDQDSDILTYRATSSAPNIATANIPTGSSILTVTPVTTGSANITVTADDGNGGTATNTFTVTVKINRVPTVANTIPNQPLTVGGTPFTQNLNLIFSDPDGDALAFSANSSAANVATANVPPGSGTLTVTAVSSGNTTIMVTATDGKSPAISTTFTVAVANRPPMVTVAISNQSLTVGGTPFTQNLTANFTDPDGDPLTFTFNSSAPAIATANIPAGSSILTVTAVSGGNAVITATATDGKSQPVSMSFTVTVANRPPVATQIQNLNLAIGGPPFTQNLNLVFSDPDGDALMFEASSNATNIATTAIANNTLTVTAAAVGSATITVTANDNKGGNVSQNFTVTVTSNSAPTVMLSSLAPQPSGQDILVQATITDDLGVPTATLHYRRGGESNFNQVSMTNTGATYRGTIPGTFVASFGVEHFILATDAVVPTLSTRAPSAGFVAIRVQLSNLDKLAAQFNGSAQTAYRLFSVPTLATNASPANVLEDDLGTYDDTKWRLFGLPSGQLPYVEFPNAGDLSPGRSLFLIVRDPGKTIDSGPATSIATDTEFSFPLVAGHNFIAAPFNFTIPATKLRLQSGGSIALQNYNGGWGPANAMSPWEGYYLANNRPSDVLFIDPKLSPSTSEEITNKTNANGWRLRILAGCAEARDDYNFAGVAGQSEDGYDDNDLAEPPPIGEYVSLYFPHPEWQKVLSRYSDDMRAPSNPNQRWRFVAETNISNAMVTLRFEGLKQVDENLTVFLVDEALKYKQNLRENAVYQYQPRSHEQLKEFTLIVGKEEFVIEQTANVQGVPENFVLEQNFPNPFNPETAIRFGLPEQSVVTIKIFDLAGHEVVTLLDRVELPAGRHQRVWNGRDAQGRTVTSGIYFYRLTGGNFSKTMKLMLMR